MEWSRQGSWKHPTNSGGTAYHDHAGQTLDGLTLASPRAWPDHVRSHVEIPRGHVPDSECPILKVAIHVPRAAFLASCCAIAWRGLRYVGSTSAWGLKRQALGHGIYPESRVDWSVTEIAIPRDAQVLWAHRRYLRLG